MVGKNNYKIVGLAVLVLLCWMGYSPLACEGVVVWSDDFNDGNYIGWTINENPALGTGANWSAANLYLEFNQSGYGVISHPSSVVNGTWSFDVKPHASSFTQVVFISNNVTELADINDWVGYWINFAASADNIILSLRAKNGGPFTTVASYETPIPIAGWHHIEVTRDTAGVFSVKHNGSLIMGGVSTEINTSVMFAVYAENSQAIDNIVVDDQFPSSIDWVLIIEIAVLAVAIIVVLVIVLKRK
ncbi:MAG: hypothetical protein ACFFCP_04975 [Promethearchaeota archaeon]